MNDMNYESNYEGFICSLLNATLNAILYFDFVNPGWPIRFCSEFCILLDPNENCSLMLKDDFV